MRRVLRWWRLAALFTAGAVLLATAGFLLTAGSAARDSPGAVNQAVTDQGGTGNVIAAVSAGLIAVYSYSYTDIPASERAARNVLSGQAATQYAQLSPVLRKAVSQRLTVRARVVHAGVIWLDGDAARLLVFLDQTTTRGNKAQGSAVPAQLVVTASHHTGRWLITGMEVPS
jgi:Mce-associated membrane protein